MTSEAQGLYFGDGSASRRLLADAAAMAATPCPILLTGESGTGKTRFARHLHALSPRRDGPFVQQSFALISKRLRHAELVGYRRGAFTGAFQDHAGYIEEANRGTLFLDELGLIGLKLQGMLLTLIEARSVQRMQEARARPVDVRFLLATTANLDEMERRGRLLPEFRYRLGEFVLHLPPLRERSEDIPPFVLRFLSEMAAEMGRSVAPTVTPEAMDLLVTAPWPGNIRQLHMACWFIIASAGTRGTVDPLDLPPSVPGGGWSTGDAASRKTAKVRQMIERFGGNKREAARELGMSPTTLYRVLAEDGPNPLNHVHARRSREQPAKDSSVHLNTTEEPHSA